MHRFVLDSNAVDQVADLPGAYETVRGAVASGEVELLFTHVARDEVAATPDQARRASLQRVLDLATPTPTGAFVLDWSELGNARLNDDEETVESLRSGSVGHTADALIAITANVESCALVTGERRRLRNRAIEAGIEVLWPRELLEQLGWSEMAT